MKFSVAVAALAAGAQAAVSNVTYTTQVVTALTTYCPASTQVTYNGVTYTVTSATTLTITNCPCTLTVPVVTSSPKPTTPVVVPTTYANTTVVKTTPAGTGAVTTTKATSVPTAGAEKAIAVGGSALAGLLGLVAFAL